MSAPKLVTCRLADVAPERVMWAWPGYVPLGKIAVLDGDPGLGRSTVTADLTARITTGRAMPEPPDGRDRPAQDPHPGPRPPAGPRPSARP